VARIGEMLREARIQWGLSLRDVKDRSHALAQQWGSRSYEVSFSWLSKLESGEHEMTLPKLISLATIYSRPPEELFRRCLPEPARSQAPYHLVGPNTTVLVTGGPLEQQARHLLPDSFTSDPLPEDTMHGQCSSCCGRRGRSGRCAWWEFWIGCSGGLRTGLVRRSSKECWSKCLRWRSCAHVCRGRCHED
jgi:transcriptional regulator with XRE-family HTH domain